MGQRSNLQVPERPSRPVRVSRDVVRNVPDPEETNHHPQPAPKEGAPPWVIVISDDQLPPDPGSVDPPLVPPRQRGSPAEVHLVRPGSRFSGTTSTVAYNYTHVGAALGFPLQVTGLSL